MGWSSNFVGFESGQIKDVKLLENMVLNRTRVSKKAGIFYKIHSPAKFRRIPQHF